MKKIIPAVAAALCIILLEGCAYGPSMDGFVYSTSDGKISITGYTGSAARAELPSSHNDKPITAIGKGAFTGTKLKEIILPDSILTVDPSAFIGSLVQSITVNGSSAKYSSENGVLYNLNKDTLAVFPAGKTDKSFELADSVRTVGVSAFEGNSVIEQIGWNSVKHISDRAFFKCTALKSVDLPQSLATVGRIAFAGCSSLESVKLPAGITSIDETAFMDCPSLKTIKVYEGTFAEQWCIDNGYESIMEYA